MGGVPLVDRQRTVRAETGMQPPCRAGMCSAGYGVRAALKAAQKPCRAGSYRRTRQSTGLPGVALHADDGTVWLGPQGAKEGWAGKGLKTTCILL